MSPLWTKLHDVSMRNNVRRRKCEQGCIALGEQVNKDVCKLKLPNFVSIFFWLLTIPMTFSSLKGLSRREGKGLHDGSKPFSFFFALVLLLKGIFYRPFFCCHADFKNASVHKFGSLVRDTETHTLLGWSQPLQICTSDSNPVEDAQNTL